MYNDDKVYKYVIDSVNDILKQGISYYDDKDNELKNKLINLYDYINGKQSLEETINEDVSVKKESNMIEPNITIDEGCCNVNDASAKEISALTDSFMGKMTDIRISVLNLENDLSLYHSNYIEEKEVNNIELDNSNKINLEPTDKTVSNLDLENTIRIDKNVIEKQRKQNVEINPEEVINDEQDSDDSEAPKGSIFDILKKRK